MNKIDFENKLCQVHDYLIRFHANSGLFAAGEEYKDFHLEELAGKFEEYCQGKQLSYVFSVIDEWKRRYLNIFVCKDELAFVQNGWGDVEAYQRCKNELSRFFANIGNIARGVCDNDVYIVKKKCKPLTFQFKKLAEDLSRIDDRYQAIDLIRSTFEAELGAVDTNDILWEILPEDKKPERKMSVNCNDPNVLFPHLAMILKENIRRMDTDKTERLNSYVDDFIKNLGQQQTPLETAKPEPQHTDFSHMKSFKPTVEFDMSALYSFLIGEGVIDDIDEELFADCISHANINELWKCEHAVKKQKHNLLQCLFKMLKDYYPEKWIDKCAENLNVDKKKITNPTTSGATKPFEDKLRLILKGKSIK